MPFPGARSHDRPVAEAQAPPTWIRTPAGRTPPAQHEGDWPESSDRSARVPGFRHDGDECPEGKEGNRHGHQPQNNLQRTMQHPPESTGVHGISPPDGGQPRWRLPDAGSHLQHGRRLGDVQQRPTQGPGPDRGRYRVLPRGQCSAQTVPGLPGIRLRRLEAVQEDMFHICVIPPNAQHIPVPNLEDPQCGRYGRSADVVAVR